MRTGATHNQVGSVAKRITERDSLETFLDRLIENYLIRRAKSLRGLRPQMSILTEDHIGYRVFVKGVFDEEEILDTINFLDHFYMDLGELTAIDVGANIGNHSIQFAKCFKHVLAIEPQPDIFKLLDLNCSKIDNIDVLNELVANPQIYKKELHSEGNRGATSFTTLKANARTSEEMTFRSKSLDQLSGHLRRVGLIKIDTEGMEAEVIASGRELIKRERPIIAFEQNRTAFVSGIETDAIDFLRAEGYAIFIPRVFKRKRVIRFRRTPQVIVRESHASFLNEEVVPGRYGIIFAVPEEKVTSNSEPRTKGEF